MRQAPRDRLVHSPAAACPLTPLKVGWPALTLPWPLPAPNSQYSTSRERGAVRPFMVLKMDAPEFGRRRASFSVVRGLG